MNRYLEANRRRWNELAELHPKTEFYRFYLDRLRAGGTSLHGLEIGEVGDVGGQSLLHLQCHFGVDSISWARRGASVTGVDFAGNAVARARRLAQEFGVQARFVRANVYDLPSVLAEKFDVIFQSWGVLGWLPDLAAWAGVVSHFLKRGGFYYIAEFHPTLWIFDGRVPGLVASGYYFRQPEPDMEDEDGSYADLSAHLENQVAYNWAYPLDLVLGSLIDAGLRIEFLHEWPRCPARMLQVLVQDDHPSERWYRMREGMPDIPLAFSLRARKP
jgi:SAM-dependent methyltransferase